MAIHRIIGGILLSFFGTFIAFPLAVNVADKTGGIVGLSVLTFGFLPIVLGIYLMATILIRMIGPDDGPDSNEGNTIHIPTRDLRDRWTK